MPTKPKTKRSAQEKTAAMFGMTAMSKEELSNAIKTGSLESGNPIENYIANSELEQMHEEEIAEAKELKLETEPIIESTSNEVIVALQKDLAESQNRYVELSEDKEKILKEKKELEKKLDAASETNASLSKENDALSKKVNQLNSELDASKTDSSRDILDCKIQIEDLQKQIAAYEQNESNYKFEITKLKAEISNLETALTEKPEAKKEFEKKMHAIPQRTIVPMFSSKPKEQVPSNGYSSWN